MAFCYTAVLWLAAMIQLVAAHSYHFGACPKVEPMKGFDMEKFLGKWYVVQKTSSSNRNQVLTYVHDDEDGGYKVLEDAVRPILRRSMYSGKLKPTDQPALMRVKFKLNPGSYDYIVFTTDYENYAGVFSCQKILGANRRAASILSRKTKLDKDLVDRVREQLSTFGVNPLDLAVIEQDEVEMAKTSIPEDLEPSLYDIDPRFGVTDQPSNSTNTTYLHLF